MKRQICLSFLIVFFTLSLLGCLPATEENPGTLTEKTSVAEPSALTEEGVFEVLRIVDGDTIEIDFYGTKEKVRFIGVDTPESVHADASKNVPYGKIASAFTHEKLAGSFVELEFDVAQRDKYKRLLAYVYLDGEMFNKTLLELGHAKVATYPPNVKYVDDFVALEKTARSKGLGVWQDYQLQYSDQLKEESASLEEDGEYIGNISTGKFHHADCQVVKKMADKNKVLLPSTAEAQKQGFVKCKICFK